MFRRLGSSSVLAVKLLSTRTTVAVVLLWLVTMMTSLTLNQAYQVIPPTAAPLESTSLSVTTSRPVAAAAATTTTRRQLWQRLLVTTTAASLTAAALYEVAGRHHGWGISSPPVAHAAVPSSSSEATITSGLAAANAGEEQVYFGAGCFWHMQHEFILAEVQLLQRSNTKQALTTTATAGYAGGTRLGQPQAPVCYHNLRQVADYGQLGHGEVVGLSLPPDKVVDFAQVYFSLFNSRTLDRVDPQDRGAEYRSLMGLPGGVQHPLYEQIFKVAQQAGFRLQAGKGNDPDTLGKRLIYVYDTAQFPFYQAEVYHQFHNDFQDVPYGRAYNQLADVALAEGRIRSTGCPDRV